jgi:hypothetical protein
MTALFSDLQKAACTVCERERAVFHFANDRTCVDGWVTNEYYNMPLVRDLYMPQAHQRNN